MHTGSIISHRSSLPANERGRVRARIGLEWERGRGVLRGPRPEDREGGEKRLSVPRRVPSIYLSGEHGNCVEKTLKDQDLTEDCTAEHVWHVFCLIALVGVLIMRL